MATEERQPADHVIAAAPPVDEASRHRERLAREVMSFAPRSRFFTVVSLLERLMPDAIRIGGDGPPSGESLRFRNDPSLIFSAGDITKVEPRKIPEDPESPVSPERDGYEVVCTFLGLTGSVSPLPLYMVEEVAQENPENPIKRDFLDLFHHRALSLLYRVVIRYMPAREHTRGVDDVWTRRYLAAVGMDIYRLAASQVLPPWLLLRLLPLLATRTRGARSLELALREALSPVLDLECGVSVRQFVGNRVVLDAGQRTQLGVMNHELGTSAVIGGRSVDRAGRFAIRIGPLTTKNYAGFMQEGQQLKVIREVVRIFTRRPLDYDVELLLSEDAVPRFRLSAEYPVPLGRATWLRARPVAQVHVIKDAMVPEASRDRGDKRAA